MSSRDDILRAVRKNRPAAVPCPSEAAFAPPPETDVFQHFCSMIEQIGGTVVAGATDGIPGTVAQHYPDAQTVVSTSKLIEGTLAAASVNDPHAFAEVDVFVCEGVVGVAESGAVWVPESRLIHRALPFIAQHLVLLLRRDALVWNLHEAYTQLSVDADGYGVFIAGPSKTADIEQSLVIGAHGPRSLTVYLY